MRRDTHTEGPPSVRVRWQAAAAAVLILFAVHAWASARHKTPTVDEFAHVPAGYLGLVSGDFSLYGKTPPLARTLFSLPLLLDQPALPEPPQGNRMAGWYPWLYASGFFTANLERGGVEFVSGLYAHARLVVIGLTVALGTLLFVWGRSWHGPAGGLLALVLFTFDPNILAHGRLATVDLAETLFFFLATALFVRHLARPSWRSLLGAGLGTGAALATKFTAVLLGPVLLGLTLVRLASAPRETRRALAGRLAAALAAIALLAVLVVNLSYGFQGPFRTLGAHDFRSRLLSGVQAAAPDWTPVPFPTDFVRGFDAQQVDLEVGDFPNYLAGQWSRQGWWYYYPLAWSAKTPLPLLLIFVAAAGLALSRRLRPDRRSPPAPPAGGEPGEGPFRSLSAWAAALAIGVLGFAACFLTRLDIGVRYLLPIYPFLFLATGSLGRLWRGRVSAPVIALAAGVAALVAATLFVFPHYLGYFNVLAGGPGRGWQLLANSNNDWGQDLIYLRRELERRGIPSVRLAYFGHVDPEVYGIDYSVPLPEGSGADALIPGAGSEPYSFRPGNYAISANLLVGLPYPVVDHGRWVPAGAVLSEPQRIYAWFRRRPPDAVIGGSILPVRVDRPAP